MARPFLVRKIQFYASKIGSGSGTPLYALTMRKTALVMWIMLTMKLAAQDSTARDMHILQQRLAESDPITWVFTGDSVTQGAKWVQGARPYSAIVEERLRWEMSRRRDIVVNTAISGNKTDDILSDFDWRIGHLHPDVVSLMIGMNDSVRGPKGERLFRDNLVALIAHIRSMGAIPILHTTNTTQFDPARTDLPAYNRIISRIAEDEQIILVDNWSYWRSRRDADNISMWLGQAIHPNGMGHAAIALQFFRALGIDDRKSAMCTLPTDGKD